MKFVYLLVMLYFLCGACSAGKADNDYTEESEDSSVGAELYVSGGKERPAFDTDSAYSFVAKLTEFGPRVPNSEAHRLSGDWLTAKLKQFGWEVVEQKAELQTFDGTRLNARNIFAQINPEKPDRLLLLAHWDSRPWADEDPDPAKRTQPVPGANDGASGVGVILEIARQLAGNKDVALDILFEDAEDWGSENDEDSWALGTQYFVKNPPVANYHPAEAILLDMVGSPDARFGFEYFSARSNPVLLRTVWDKAASLGHGNYFHNGFGGAVTDDHIPLIKHGIPAIDIIDYRNTPGMEGFDPVWHTTRDDLSNISRQTLKAVGETLVGVIKERN